MWYKMWGAQTWGAQTGFLLGCLEYVRLLHSIFLQSILPGQKPFCKKTREQTECSFLTRFNLLLYELSDFLILKGLKFLVAGLDFLQAVRRRQALLSSEKRAWE